MKLPHPDSFFVPNLVLASFLAHIVLSFEFEYRQLQKFNKLFWRIYFFDRASLLVRFSALICWIGDPFAHAHICDTLECVEFVELVILLHRFNSR